MFVLWTPYPLQAARQVPLSLTQSPITLNEYPLATGVPIPRGELRSADNVRLINSIGVELPIQTGVLANWPDMDEPAVCATSL